LGACGMRMLAVASIKTNLGAGTGVTSHVKE
jgi:hypothetical protein